MQDQTPVCAQKNPSFPLAGGISSVHDRGNVVAAGGETMAWYREVDRSPKFIAVDFAAHILSGTFEHAVDVLVDGDLDLSAFATAFKNDATGAPALYPPGVLLKIVLLGYSRGLGAGAAAGDGRCDRTEEEPEHYYFGGGCGASQREEPGASGSPGASTPSSPTTSTGSATRATETRARERQPQ